MARGSKVFQIDTRVKKAKSGAVGARMTTMRQLLSHTKPSPEEQMRSYQRAFGKNKSQNDLKRDLNARPGANPKFKQIMNKVHHDVTFGPVAPAGPNKAALLDSIMQGSYLPGLLGQASRHEHNGKSIIRPNVEAIAQLQKGAPSFQPSHEYRAGPTAYNRALASNTFKKFHQDEEQSAQRDIYDRLQMRRMLEKPRYKNHYVVKPISKKRNKAHSDIEQLNIKKMQVHSRTNDTAKAVMRQAAADYHKSGGKAAGFNMTPFIQQAWAEHKERKAGQAQAPPA